MKLKTLTGALQPSVLIEIVESGKTLFLGNVFDYFESETFKTLGNKSVLSVNAESKNMLKIFVSGGVK
jgi:hypothetical protein